MYYREKQDPMPNKDGNRLWRPDIVRTGKIIGVKQLSKLISTATTLTEADVTAVLCSLPQFMDLHLREGHTVRLDNIGTFTVYGRSKGKGVVDKKDVRPSQFEHLVLKFRPEYTMSVGGVQTRALLNDIEFVHINRLLKGGLSDGEDNDTDDDIIDPDA